MGRGPTFKIVAAGTSRPAGQNLGNEGTSHPIPSRAPFEVAGVPLGFAGATLDEWPHELAPHWPRTPPRLPSSCSLEHAEEEEGGLRETSGTSRASCQEDPHLTGLAIWPASRALAKYLEKHRRRLFDANPGATWVELSKRGLRTVVTT